ncbi:sulfotransferase [Salegentibacter sediminis]|uniref:sulfotransferase n=1 Tax=Salegentibacter sediminis TaxID=1930251 RepID=UPI0009BDAF27|nr:sulfotransferase [Salegentibacter sediminis]
MKFNKIAIHSVPRSGSTWLGSIFDSHPRVAYRFQPLFSYMHKNQLNEKSSLDDINRFFKDILQSTDDFVLQKDAIRNSKVPNFTKKTITHIVYKEVRYHNILENLLKQDDTSKIIGLLRNPFSVINSWLRAPKEFKKELDWNIEEEWRFAPKKNLNKPEEFNGYEKWKEVTFLFLNLKKNYPERFYLVNYDSLLTDKNTVVKDLFNFCGLEMTTQTLDFLNKSSKLNNEDAYSVFKKKSKDDNWQTELPHFIFDEIKADEDFKVLNKVFKWI